MWLAFSALEIVTVVVNIFFLLVCAAKYPSTRFLNFLVGLAGILCGVIAVAVWFKVGMDEGIEGQIDAFKDKYPVLRFLPDEFKNNVKASPVLSCFAMVSQFVGIIFVCFVKRQLTAY